MEKQPKTVHHILSYSYTAYFFGIIFALIIQQFFPISLYKNPDFGVIGFLLLVLGSFFIYWAQHTTQITEEKRHSAPSPEDFKKGPYKFSRSPTHLGLVMLCLGVGFLFNSLFVFIFSFVSFFVSHLFFLNQQDKILEEKYGEPYKEYKKSVSRWL